MMGFNVLSTCTLTELAHSWMNCSMMPTRRQNTGPRLPSLSLGGYRSYKSHRCALRTMGPRYTT